MHTLCKEHIAHTSLDLDDTKLISQFQTKTNSRQSVAMVYQAAASSKFKEECTVVSFQICLTLLQ